MMGSPVLVADPELPPLPPQALSKSTAAVIDPALVRLNNLPTEFPPLCPNTFEHVMVREPRSGPFDR
jgi:hypothetical protein